MPRKSLRVTVKVSIQAVTCPGVILKDKEDVYLNFVVLGKQMRTMCLPPVFPLLFHHKFKFEKTFPYCSDLVQLARHLEKDIVLVELIQLNEDISDDGKVLAYYHTTLRDFLYPENSLIPTYADSEQEVLMTRSVWFSGISPKLEFSCNTSVANSNTPALDSYWAEAIDDLNLSPTKNSNKKKSRRTKSYEFPTHLSINKSPKRRIKTNKLDERAPFIIKRHDSHNRAVSPSRSLPPRRPLSAPVKDHSRSSRRSLPPNPRHEASSFISEDDCQICQVYIRYLGHRYWGHRKFYHPSNTENYPATSHTDLDEYRSPSQRSSRMLYTDLNDVSSQFRELDLAESHIDAILGSDVEYARLPYSPRSRSLSRGRSRSPSPSRSKLRGLSRSRSPSPSHRKLRGFSPSRSLALSRHLNDSNLADVIHNRVRRSLSPNLISDSESVTSEEALDALRASLTPNQSATLSRSLLDHSRRYTHY